MRYSGNMPEEELKIRVGQDWFGRFDSSKKLKTLDFAVSALVRTEDLFYGVAPDVYYLWAEAKKGAVDNILIPLAQLVLTIGKEKLPDKYLPPKYLAAFDAEKIAFVEYYKIADFFTQNDFNWSVTPSDHSTKEFQQVLGRLSRQNGRDLIHFNWESDAAELKKWIAANFKSGADTARIRITKNNFTAIYAKWRTVVMPTIDIDWNAAKKGMTRNGKGLLDADFYLADILSADNKTLEEKLRVVLCDRYYQLDKHIGEFGEEIFKQVNFRDNGEAHAQFWNVYQRPPRKEYWDYIIERRDLLVPQDVREVKGAFFTPAKWVNLSQQYLADTLGEDWQQEYYIWDCCAGTGNLLAGLTEPGRIYASTLDQSDVDVIKTRIKTMNAAGSDGKGANLLPGNVFQFDFLNDDLLGDKVPPTLRAIIADPEKRKKLVIYINPPYKEAGNKRAITTEEQGNNPDVAKGTEIGKKYKPLIGPAANELFALFLIRIHQELQCCKLAQFAKLKALCAPNFARFRNVFQSRLLNLFLVPGDTFDNVDGDFPIGFFVWDLEQREPFTAIDAHVYDSKANRLPDKCVFAPPAKGLWMDWVKSIHDKQGERIAYFSTTCSDFQHQNLTFLTLAPSANDFLQHRTHDVTVNNFFAMMVAMAVRLVPKATWLNDRDQFLYPSDSWAEDVDFQNDCLIYTLFHGQNRVSAKETEPLASCNKETEPLASCKKGSCKIPSSSTEPEASSPCINHWIPFTEAEVGAQASFASHFMSDFLRGRRDAIHRVSNAATQGELFGKETKPPASCNGGIGEASLHEAGGFVSLKAEDIGSSNRRLVGDAINRVSTNRPKSAGNIITQLTPAARAVYEAGLALWRYYHKTASNKRLEAASPDYNPNASFYDIRAYFQGFTNGKMNSDSPDTTYTALIAALRAALDTLAAQIEPKIYEHGFLKR